MRVRVIESARDWESQLQNITNESARDYLLSPDSVFLLPIHT